MQNRLAPYAAALVIFAALLFAPSRSSGQALDDYKLAAQDIILVDVFNEKELSREFRISAKGEISFPPLGNIAVAGKTPSEVEAELEQKLGEDYLVEPHVTVSVKEYRMRTITVLGEVNKPGAVPLLGEEPMTIMEAIARAGGLTRLANEGKIEFTREGKTETFSMEKLKKIDRDKATKLQPGDLINVRQSFI